MNTYKGTPASAGVVLGKKGREVFVGEREKELQAKKESNAKLG